MIKFAIKDFFGVEYSVLSSNITTSKKNSHGYMIEFVKREIKGKVDFIEEKRFNRNINDLKQFRIESDYEDIEIDQDKGEKAMKIASDLRKFLQQKLHAL